VTAPTLPDALSRFTYDTYEDGRRCAYQHLVTDAAPLPTRDPAF